MWPLHMAWASYSPTLGSKREHTRANILRGTELKLPSQLEVVPRNDTVSCLLCSFGQSGHSAHTDAREKRNKPHPLMGEQKVHTAEELKGCKVFLLPPLQLTTCLIAKALLMFICLLPTGSSLVFTYKQACISVLFKKRISIEINEFITDDVCAFLCVQYTSIKHLEKW